MYSVRASDSSDRGWHDSVSQMGMSVLIIVPAKISTERMCGVGSLQESARQDSTYIREGIRGRSQHACGAALS